MEHGHLKLDQKKTGKEKKKKMKFMVNRKKNKMAVEV